MAMNVLEKEIEDLVFECLEGYQGELINRGFALGRNDQNHETFYLRQYNLGSYGIADIIGVTLNRYSRRSRIIVTIYELKKDQIGPATLTQALRYAKGVERMVKVLFPIKNFELAFEFVLVGKTVCDDDWIYMADYFRGLTLVTYSVDLSSGVKFTKHSQYSIDQDMVGDVTKRAKLKYKEAVRYFINNPAPATPW